MTPEQCIKTERLTSNLLELLAIPSISGTQGEVEIQQHLVNRWRQEGWTVESWTIDPQELAKLPNFPGMEVDRRTAVGALLHIPGTGGGRNLLLNGHTDVVPPGNPDAWTMPPFAPQLSHVGGQSRITGRGACDMKAGLVAAWEAIRALDESGKRLKGDIFLAPVSGEEDGGLGTFSLIRHLQSRNRVVDACIIPEPTGLDVVPANGGALTFRLRVPGLAAHASRRTEGVSAIENFLPIMHALKHLEDDRNARVDPLMQRWPIAYPLSIGTAAAGDWASSVPDLLIAEGRLGVALGESASQARLALENTVAQACQHHEWLKDNPVQVEWWGGQFDPGHTDPDSEICRAIRDAHLAATHVAPATYGAPYGSDLRLLTTLGSIPTAQYGPGDSAHAHGPDEYVNISDLTTCAKVLTNVIADFCG